MKLGLIGAMEEELVPIRTIVHDLEKIEKGNQIFWEGEDYGTRSSSPAAIRARSTLPSPLRR